MTTLYLILFLLAGVFFAAHAFRVQAKIDLVALGLLMWVAVPFLQTIQRV